MFVASLNDEDLEYSSNTKGSASSLIDYLGFDGSQCCITIQHPTQISHVVSGHLLNSSKKCFAFARGKTVEYVEFLPVNKRLQTLHTVEIFGSICNMTTILYLEHSLKEDGSSSSVEKDAIVLTTDAGLLIILQYKKLSDFGSKLLQEQKSKQKLFEKIVYPFCQPYKNAEFPEHFLATDPMGHIILIGAVYDKIILYRKPESKDDSLKNFVASVIDYTGYKIYDIVGLTSEQYFARFAILRSKNKDKNSDHEIDLFNFNKDGKFIHRSEELGNKAKLLAPFMESGILAVADDSIVFKSLSSNLHLKKEVFDDEDCFVLVTPFKQDFVLAQSSVGNVFLFRIDIQAREITILCVDFLPAARCWCSLVLNDDTYLFVSSEFSDHVLYGINYSFLIEKNIFLDQGDDDKNKDEETDEEKQVEGKEVVAMQVEEKEEEGMEVEEIEEEEEVKMDEERKLANEKVEEKGEDVEEDQPEDKKQFFKPLVVVSNYSPLFDSQIGDLYREGYSQIYIVGGRSNYSYLRVLEPGIKIEREEELCFQTHDYDEGASFANMPKRAWICDWYLLAEDEVLLFETEDEITKVFVLSCAKESDKRLDELCNQMDELPFCTDNCTLYCVQLGEDILQILPSKVILISKSSITWQLELDPAIQLCAANKCNVGLYSKDGYLIYIWFGCNKLKSEALSPEWYTSDYNRDLTLLAIGKVREKNKSPLIAAVECDTVRVIFLEKQLNLKGNVKQVGGRKFSEEITSIEIISIKTLEDEDHSSEDEEHSSEDEDHYFSRGYDEFLLVGLKNGYVYKYKLNGYESVLDEDIYYLDSTPVTMTKVTLFNQEAVIANQHIICHVQGYIQLLPLISDTHYDYFIPFSREQNCLLGCKNGQIDFVVLPTFETILGTKFMVKLESTPCRIILDEFWRKIIVLERERKVFLKACEEVEPDYLMPYKIDDNEGKPVAILDKSGWFSQIQIVDPLDRKTVQQVPLEGNAYAMCACSMNASPKSGFLIVCALLEFEEVRKRSGVPMALTYEISYEDKENAIKSSIDCLDKTPLEGLPTAICAYKGKILIAEGDHFGLYRIHERQLELLSKKKLTDEISSITAIPKYNLIFAGHGKNNVSSLRLSDCDKILFVENHYLAGPLVAFFNQDTLIDDFGDLMLTPKSSYDTLLGLENLKLVIQSNCNVCKLVKLQQLPLRKNARSCLLYMTNSGSVGIVIRNTHSDKTFLLNLRKYMIANNVSFQSSLDEKFYYQEKESVIDGDLCMEYLSAKKDFKIAIASEMEKSPQDIFDCLQHMKMTYCLQTSLHLQLQKELIRLNDC